MCCPIWIRPPRPPPALPARPPARPGVGLPPLGDVFEWCKATFRIGEKQTQMPSTNCLRRSVMSLSGVSNSQTFAIFKRKEIVYKKSLRRSVMSLNGYYLLFLCVVRLLFVFVCRSRARPGLNHCGFTRANPFLTPLGDVLEWCKATFAIFRIGLTPLGDVLEWCKANFAIFRKKQNA